MNALIERYMADVLDRVPERQRTGVAADVRGAIAEMVDGRVDHGEPEEVAVRSALNELGDPGLLAARYREGPDVLIGPRWYPAYIEILKRVFWAAIAVSVVISLVVSLIEDGSVGEAVTGAGSTAYWVATQVLLWLTLAFAVAERTSFVPPERPAAAWTIDDLPADRGARQITRGDALPAIVALAIFGAVAVVQHVRGVGLFSGGDDDAWADLALINPDLGAGWIVVFFALLALSAGTAVLSLREGYWTQRVTGLVMGGAVLWIAYVAALAFAEPVFNPALTARIDEANPGRWEAGGPANLVVLVLIAAVSIQEAWEAYRGHQEYQRLGR